MPIVKKNSNALFNPPKNNLVGTSLKFSINMIFIVCLLTTRYGWVFIKSISGVIILFINPVDAK